MALGASYGDSIVSASSTSTMQVSMQAKMLKVSSRIIIHQGLLGMCFESMLTMQLVINKSHKHMLTLPQPIRRIHATKLSKWPTTSQRTWPFVYKLFVRYFEFCKELVFMSTRSLTLECTRILKYHDCFSFIISGGPSSHHDIQPAKIKANK